MRILVTGCMGFIGSNLCSYLLNGKQQVIGFDNLSNSSILPTDRIKRQVGGYWNNFKFYNADIRDFKQMHSITVNERPDLIVHLAALGSVPRSFEYPTDVVDVNEKGFCNIMQLAKFCGIRRVVFASSSSVYGDSRDRVKIEGHEGHQISPYALSKKHNEDFARIWAPRNNVQYVGLRFFNVYGPGQLTSSMYSSVIPRFINDQQPVIYGDGTTVRDFTYVEDVCSAIGMSLLTENHNFVANVGTGEGTSLNELAKLLGIDNIVTNKNERVGDVKTSIASTAFAKEMLKFKSRFNIVNGLSKTVDFYRSLMPAELHELVHGKA